jgi:hypothetical protein
VATPAGNGLTAATGHTCDPMTATTAPINADTWARANAAGRRLIARGLLARTARHQAGRIHVELINGCAVAFPPSHVRELAAASAATLRDIEVTASGLGLRFPHLDVDLYVPTLIKTVLRARRV